MSRFTADFCNGLYDLMKWRRDVRHFSQTVVDPSVLQSCLDTFLMAPSVGLSEPWRVIRLESESARKAALDNYSDANSQALAGYQGQKAQLYSRMKLSGMTDAPVQLAVFCDESTDKGAGLGQMTMPEMRRYSVVGAITHFWLAARAKGLGVGWVSILDPDRLSRDLDVPQDWTLVAYLCVGWPETASDTPELERAGWEDRRGHLPIEDR